MKWVGKAKKGYGVKDFTGRVTGGFPTMAQAFNKLFKDAAREAAYKRQLKESINGR